MTDGTETTNGIVLSLEGVGKRYGHVVAAQGISFDLGRNEFLVLVGPSGCGKSTLLRLISGLEPVDSGTIEIAGSLISDPVTTIAPELRHVSLVFQDNALLPHMTVAANVAFGLKGWSRDTKMQRVAELLEVVRLVDVAKRYPHELSGGQQQRVALARALAPQPTVVLMDEPFSDLDRGLRIALRDDVKRILATTHTPAILVTHDQEEALVLGDRVAVQRAGEILQIGTPEEVFSLPASRFVAEFMGETDFICGEVTGDGVRTEIGSVKQPVDLPLGTRVEVALRPDDVQLKQDPDAPGRVLSRAFSGMVNLYRLQLPSGDVVRSLQPHTVDLPVGTSVRVTAEPGHPLAYFRKKGR